MGSGAQMVLSARSEADRPLRGDCLRRNGPDRANGTRTAAIGWMSPRPAKGLSRRAGRIAGILFALVLATPAAADDHDALIFAAASLTDAMTVVAEAYADRTGTRIAFSFAASSALARQIENGAPASMFVSANELWMDRLQAAGLIAKETRSNIAGNRLALIAPRNSTVSVELTRSLDFAALLGDGRLAIGDPDHVPAGIYGRAALESLGLWPDASPWLARTSDVRGALALVARGEVPLGIVYATDAAVTGQVRVVGLFPADSHPAIVYPAALTTAAGDDARDFLRFLAGPEAQAILQARGFSTPPRGSLDPAS